MFRHLSRPRSQHINVSAIAAISCTISCSYFILSKTKSDNNAESLDSQFKSNSNPNIEGIIETELMDKIALKPYLNYHIKYTPKESRPAGVPDRLRILAIDVPKFRHIFDEQCFVDHSAIFPDGIAYPKTLQIAAPKGEISQDHDTNYSNAPTTQQTSSSNKSISKNKNNEKHIQIEIMQKSFIKSLLQCGKNKKTILLEASISNLNPRNMKRRYEFKTKDNNTNHQNLEHINHSPEGTKIQGISNINDCPWHQRAWMEEIDLRINGKVAFSAPLEPSSKLSRILFGNYYRTTIQTSTSFLGYIFFPFMSKSFQNSDGIDSSRSSHNTRASNKPHAVIVDGTAMQSIPGSLLHLSRCCKEANVPLFIINDQRWGKQHNNNSHSDITLASQDLRKTVKSNIVKNALKVKEGSSFERGRTLGKLETQLGHQIQKASDQTKKAFLEAKKSLKGDDWSNFDEKALKQELRKRKVITVGRTPENNEEEVLTCTEGMLHISKNCLKTQNGSKIDALRESEFKLGDANKSLD